MIFLFRDYHTKSCFCSLNVSLYNESDLIKWDCVTNSSFKELFRLRFLNTYQREFPLPSNPHILCLESLSLCMLWLSTLFTNQPSIPNFISSSLCLIVINSCSSQLSFTDKENQCKRKNYYFIQYFIYIWFHGSLDPFGKKDIIFHS